MWKHARERIDPHEAYYWMDKEEETMWAKDEICFQHLALNEMKRSTNTNKWVAGMIGTEIEVARTIEAWMQRRGGLWLDWATIRFRFFGHCATCTGSFCVFGPVFVKELSSSWNVLPCYGTNLNRNISDFMRWPQIDLGAQDLNDIQRPKSFQKNSWK
jgi:hypothetical protein